MAAAEPAAVRVGLCGRAARVELRPDEGLNELRARVADAFGLTAPFDLVDPQGVPMRTDMDTPLSRAGGTFPEVTVDAGEEVLLDLERAHEETGAIRWVMLRKVLAGLRRQVAEAHAGIGDAQHRAAILDEQLVRERSSREAGDAAACADLRGLVQRLEEDIDRSRKEAQAGLKASTTELHRIFEDALGRLETKCVQDTAAVKQELQAEKEERRKGDEEAAKGLAGVQSAAKLEAEVLPKELQPVRDAIAAVQASVERERSERLNFQVKVDTETAELGVRLMEEQSLRDHDVRSMKDSLGEAREALREEGLRREEALQAASRHIQEAAAKAEAQLKEHEVSLTDRLDTLAGLEGLIIELTDKERSKREIELCDFARSLEDFTGKIESSKIESGQMEERIQKSIGEIAANAESGRRALEEKLDGKVSPSLASLHDRLQDQERSRVKDMESIRKDVDLFREEVGKWKKDNQDAGIALAEAQDRKREEGMEEVRRMHAAHSEEQREWASLLIQQLSKDLRTEHEALQSDHQRRSEEFAKKAAEHVKVEMLAEVSRVENAAAERIRGQDAALSDDRKLREKEAQQTASEVRDCLTSHSEFMEALEHEQQILINRLNEGLAFEDQKRESLGQRIQAFELDMQKVKGHLPILFAVPTAFR